MDNVVKQTELLEKTGVYDEDLKRRFALTLKYNGMKGKKVLVIGMNPASNSVQVFDNTTNYLLNNLGIMGYSEIVVWNLFADICTKLKPTQTGDNTENMEYLQELLNEKFNAVLIGWGNTFIGNRRVHGEAKSFPERYLCKLQEDVKGRCHRTYTNGVFTVSVYQRIVGGLSERKYQCRKYYGAYDWRIFYRKNYRSTSGSVLWKRTRLSWK